jgi:hypothetical protein
LGINFCTYIFISSDYFLQVFTHPYISVYIYIYKYIYMGEFVSPSGISDLCGT